MLWPDFVREVAKRQFKYPGLAPAFLAQAMLESGHGSSRLFKLHNNPCGMKFRDEMVGYAQPVKYETNSEPTGSATFCSFESAKKAVDGYWHFLSRSPYNGWENMVVSAEKFLEFIGPIWCAAGYTKQWKNAHGGLNYHQYLIKNMLPAAIKQIAEAEENPVDVTWFEAYRIPKANYIETGVVAYAGSQPRFTWRGVDTKALSEFLLAFPNARNILVAPDSKPWPVITDRPNPEPQPTGKRILLDPGHSVSMPGASSRGRSVHEEVLNAIQARVLKDFLVSRGFEVEIYDPDPDNLRGIGRRAAGFDMFLSLHHNSYSGSGDPYTCAMVDNDKSKLISRKFAALCAGKVARAIGNPIFTGTTGMPEGVYQAGLAVLDEAEQYCDGPCVLVESYFINKWNNASVAAERSTKAANAIGEAVTEWFAGQA